MKFLNELTEDRIFFFQQKWRQGQGGQRKKVISGLMGVLLFLCFVPVTPTLAENIVWASKNMTAYAMVNFQTDPWNGVPRTSSDLPVSAIVLDSNGKASALTGGPGRGGNISAKSYALAWGDIQKGDFATAIGSSGFFGTFMSSYSYFLLYFDVYGWGSALGSNIKVVQLNSPDPEPPTLYEETNIVPGRPCFAWIGANGGFPLLKLDFIAQASANDMYSKFADASCQITPQLLSEVVLAVLPNGIKIVMMAGPEGIRVVRLMKLSNGQLVDFIAGCYFINGKNDFGPIGETNKYRWTNMEPAAVAGKYSKVDVYEYDGNTDTLTKIRYEPDPINTKDAKQVYEESSDLIKGEFSGGRRWWGNPQADSEALDTVQLSSGSLNQAPLTNASQSTSGIASSVIMPRSTLTCYSTDGAQWSYGLSVSDFTGGLVSPGDRIVIEGSGIAGGSVASKAATTAYGAWIVKDVSGGKIVFEATVGARFADMADGFIVNGKKGAHQGELTYRNLCNFIGGTGQVPGPVNSNIVPMLMLLLGD